MNKEFLIPNSLPISSLVFEANEAHEILILLHGYKENGRRMLIDFESKITNTCSVYAPNGFIPIPKQDFTTTRFGYAWFFQSIKSDTGIIPLKWAAETLSNWIKLINPKKLPVKLIGFSQGGILAMQMINSIDELVEVSTYGVHPLLEPINFKKAQNIKINCYHGRHDEIIPLSYVMPYYDEMKNECPYFSLQIFEGGHEMKVFN
jgi:predicted esterase